MQDHWICPSILAADFSKLGEEISAVLAAGADAIHVDVMDNHYVPNLTLGPMVVSSLRRAGIDAFFDVHLMTSPVDALIPSFAEAGANLISFHPEATWHVHRTISLIRSHGLKVGLALNPATPLSVLDHVLSELDLVLVMSVNPGFGGQAFIPETLQKVKRLRAMLEEHEKPIRLQVDGGVNESNVAALAEAGCDTFVMGTAVFAAQDYSATLHTIREKLEQAL